MKKKCFLLIWFFVIIVAFNFCVEAEENESFKKWCISTFYDGERVYDGYKDIAFNIKYTAEGPKTDIWHTPPETERSKKGDCEDGVFCYWSYLLPNYEYAEIVWGWVTYRNTRESKAHVWYQLIGKNGEKYVVEGFSSNWNGIIPMDTIKKTEYRESMLTIPHSQLSNLYTLVSRPDSIESYQKITGLYGSPDYIESTLVEESNTARFSHRKPDIFLGNNALLPRFNFSWGCSKGDRRRLLSKERKKIFKKLHEMFSRYYLEKERFK